MRNPKRWARVVEVFTQALERAVEERSAYLDKVCVGDADLRAEVAGLLESHATGGRFDALLGVLAAGWSSTAGGRALVGERVGPFRVLRELGQGGMGAVYLAEREDPLLPQRVALKLVSVGAASREVGRRFLMERKILARLEHPNIARFLDGGVTDAGVPWFAMEYVEGERIDRYAENQGLGVRERLDLFCVICDAVQYAHQLLVVHRDLKPANVLVDGAGTVKLLDFGIARLLEEGEATPVTRTLFRRLTPEYASPEQFRGEPVSTASDSYSLGVLLYELLTRAKPYHLADLAPAAAERVVCETDPDPPSAVVAERSPGPLSKRLRGDLDTIVLKALRKEPERRYATAEELASDIRRYLAGLPVRARRETLGYRARKFVYRHRAGVAAAALVLLALVGGAAGTVWQARRATREAVVATAERDRARREATKAERVSTFLTDLFELSDPNEAVGRRITARELLDSAAVKLGEGGDLAEEPEVRGVMLYVMGNAYRNLGLYEDASRLLHEALGILRTSVGRESANVARVLNGLGLVFYTRSELDSAEASYREAITIQETLDDPSVSTSLNNLALVLQVKGEYAESERLYREVLQRERERFPEPDEGKAKTLSNLGWSLETQGKLEAADTIFREVLRIRRALHGDVHPAVATSLHSLATLLFEKGEFEAAEPLAREALAMHRSLLGNGHVDVTHDLLALANIRHARGADAEAEALYREALGILRTTFGEEHVAVARVSNDLAGLLKERGDYAAAEPLYRRAWSIYRTQLGDDHPFTGIVLGNVASVLHARGDFIGAEPLYQRALRTLRDAWGDEHAMTAGVVVDLGELALDRGDATAAEPFLHQGLATLERALPKGHRKTEEARGLLGLCLVRLARYEEAEPLLTRSYQALREAVGPEGRGMRRALERLIALYDAWNKPEKAAEYRAFLTHD